MTVSALIREQIESPPAREAWIEIHRAERASPARPVASREGGVD